VPFYERGDTRIRYEEAGAGFPLLVIPGGGLNSAVDLLARHPCNPLEEFADEYRVIAADLGNANASVSRRRRHAPDSAVVGTARDRSAVGRVRRRPARSGGSPGRERFLVLGFCIGGPFIWNLLRRAPERIRAAVFATERLKPLALRHVRTLLRAHDPEPGATA
jgi:pimeloyl-ACP methyl ester carboxylesterase